MRRAIYFILAAVFAGYAYAAWRADSTQITADMTEATADGFAPASVGGGGGGGIFSSTRNRVAISIGIGVGQ
jgi:hypothetical protein